MGWRGAVSPLTPPTATAHEERWTRRVGEDPRQRGGACRVAREGALRRVDAVGSGAPVGGPGAPLDRGARRCGARAHPRAGADRGEPEPDRPLGQYLQSERRGRRDRRPPGRHRAGAHGAGRRRSSPTPMHIKFLARGTGSARAAADYLLGARDATGQLREGVEVLQGESPSGGRGGRCAGVRAQVHVGRDCLGTGRHSDRRADRSRTRRVREDGVGGARAGPLRLVGRGAPRARRRRSRACPRRAMRPGDRPEPQHRAAGLAEDVRPAARRLQRRTRLEPAG